MEFPFFTGRRTKAEKEGWMTLPHSRFGAETDPEYYETDAELADAVNVALLMGKPLLLTGEPGTGKTQLAYRLAWELGFDPPLKFETKSDSVARDLFYTYNVLSRFYDAQCHLEGDAMRYITYNALGKAIILANDPTEVRGLGLVTKDFKHGGIRRSVVLIDEIDKAPRDFPNDILNEIEQMYFRIPELDNARVESPPDKSPVVVITSNSEKHLPDPFLRRCIYHHIRFPTRDRMEKIIEGRLRHILTSRDKPADINEEFLKDAVALFYALRAQEQRLSKKPSTAELIVWIQAMREMSDAENPIADDRGSAVRSLGALVKTGDLEQAREFVAEWRKTAQTNP